ncbi:hypothetical protein DFP93_102110 [Aneurinibacillus soli]|uniref:Uncharacterized protein n=1 Tax=Aneurinibacillus soli TaxID=1500254 RepID=A0A0U5AV62_9BACL|nr:hypothetical protein [Aneurinibacillus soli]PYE63426.1 hypothetical protein DFP93_102110 [Aneurinibacillus soli]BAU27642.1 hypothetical protein CB4_01816 [Aneurinibacillus soli]
MASIYAYKINYSGMTWAEVPVRYKADTERILREKYSWIDEQLNTLKDSVAA